MFVLAIFIFLPAAVSTACFLAYRRLAAFDRLHRRVGVLTSACTSTWIFLGLVAVHTTLVQTGLLGGNGGGPVDIVLQLAFVPGRLALHLFSTQYLLLCGLCATEVFDPDFWINLVIWFLVVHLWRLIRRRAELSPS